MKKEEIIIKINGVEKVVEFKDVYTRKISREYMNILGEGATNTIGKDGEPVSNINISAISKANDFLVVNMTNLSMDDVDSLSEKDFQAVLTMVRAITNPGN